MMPVSLSQEIFIHVSRFCRWPEWQLLLHATNIKNLPQKLDTRRIKTLQKQLVMRCPVYDYYEEVIRFALPFPNSKVYFQCWHIDEEDEEYGDGEDEVVCEAGVYSKYERACIARTYSVIVSREWWYYNVTRNARGLFRTLNAIHSPRVPGRYLDTNLYLVEKKGKSLFAFFKSKVSRLMTLIFGTQI